MRIMSKIRRDNKPHNIIMPNAGKLTIHKVTLHRVCSNATYARKKE